MKYFLFCIIIFLINSLPSYAEVILDGTLGPRVALVGPDYQISAELGQQHGGNLFHSFQDFNLQSFESATFAGSANINNVISRVTGGHPSYINGTLRSIIPNADMYFLNPYGIIFGSNARLDVPGSFHASTADTLRLQDGGEFNARQPSSSLLTVAPVEAFGFLTDAPASITVQDSQLAVLKNNVLSLLGGDLHLNATSIPLYDENQQSTFQTVLFAESGQLNLASIASKGEIIPMTSGLSLSAKAQRGTITTHNTALSVSGEPGGHIFIRGEYLQLINSALESNVLGDEDGGLINISVGQLDLQGTETISGIFTHTLGTGQGSTIDLQVNQLNLSNLAQIANITLGTGKGGTTRIKVVEDLTISGATMSEEISSLSGIFNGSVSEDDNAGDAGDLKIEARQMTLREGGQILNVTQGPGKSGTTHLKVTENLIINGQLSRQWNSPSRILHLSLGKQANAGDIGDINIEAHQIILKHGGQILNHTLSAGNSGTINLFVTDTLSIAGTNDKGIKSGIVGQSGNEEITNNSGNAANINIVANQIVLNEGARISSETVGTGQGGTIQIKDVRQIRLNNGAQISSDTVGMGQGGTIQIKGVDSLILTGQEKSSGFASSISTTSLNQTAHAGNAGQIEIAARQIILTDGGAIYGATLGPGNGGAIFIVTDQLIAKGGIKLPWKNSDNPIIRFLPSGVFASTASIEGNTGKAGQIEINARQILLEDGGQINNDSLGKGDGGSIIVQTDTLTATGKYTRGEPVYNSGIVSRSNNAQSYAGKAGNILVSANTITLNQDGKISTESTNAIGGNITVNTANRLYLKEGAITTSVQGGTGDGGNISIENPVFVVLDKGQITAQADEGNGGNIHINAEQFIASESLVSASSKLGIDGEVEIDSPEINLDEFIVVLPGRFLETSVQSTACRSRFHHKNRFLVKHLKGSPPSPYDWKTSPLLLLEEKS